MKKNFLYHIEDTLLWHSVCHVKLTISRVVIYVGSNVLISRCLTLVVSSKGWELFLAVFLLFWALIVLAVVLFCSVFSYRCLNLQKH